MMISDELTAEYEDALRAGDRRRVDVIRQIRTEVAVAKSAPGFSGAVDDELHREVISAYVKKMDKARREYEELGERGRRQAEKLAFEVDYLRRWLPDRVGRDDTMRLVDQAIDELGAEDPKMVGRVVGHVMRSSPDLDGALVHQLVRERLGA